MYGVIYYYIVYGCKVKWNEEYEDFLYIGQTRDFKKRHNDHLSPSKINNQLVNRMLQTHRYDFGILWEGDANHLTEMESEYIRKYSSLYPEGLNMVEEHQPIYNKCPKDEKWCAKHSESMKEAWRRKKEEGCIWNTGYVGLACYFIDEMGVIRTYPSIKDCATDVGLTPTSVRKSIYSEKRRAHSPKYGAVKIHLIPS